MQKKVLLQCSGGGGLIRQKQGALVHQNQCIRFCKPDHLVFQGNLGKIMQNLHLKNKVAPFLLSTKREVWAKLAKHNFTMIQLACFRYS